MSKLTPQILAMYLGCEVLHCEPEGVPYKCLLIGVSFDPTEKDGQLRVHLYESDGEDGYEGKGEFWRDEDQIQLILRKLEDMAEEEARECFLIPNEWSLKIDRHGVYMYTQYDSHLIDFTRLQPNWFAYLLSKSFDLFNLIESGEAIDQKTLK